MLAALPRLPLTLQFIVAMLAHAIDDRMARKVEYLQEEIRVLKELLAAETGSARMAFNPDQRRRLAVKGRALAPEDSIIVARHDPPDGFRTARD